MKKFGKKAKILEDYNKNESFKYNDNSHIFNNSISFVNPSTKDASQKFSFFEKNFSNNFSVCNENQKEKLNSLNYCNINCEKELRFEFKKSSKRNLTREKFNIQKDTNIPNDNRKLLKNNKEINERTNFEIFQHDVSKSKKQYDLDELEKNNLYLILNIKENATKEEIKKSYRDLSKKLHPDKGGLADDFVKLNKAYKILTNETCRVLYDQFSVDSFNMIDIILKEEQ